MVKDFFIVDVFDNLLYKDDFVLMEYFIFILFKCKDLCDFSYINGNIYIFIKFNLDGLLMIFDKDILFYCGFLFMD